MLTPDAPPYKFTLLSPYDKMTATILRVAAGMRCTIATWDVPHLNDAGRIAQEAVAQDRPEVILSRGGTAHYVRSSLETPVVSISMTALDLLRTLLPFSGKIYRAAFFHYQEPVPEVQNVAAALGIAIDEYVFLTASDMVQQMLEAKARGAELGVGGNLVSQMREICDLEGVLMDVGEDAVLRALREACALADLQRVERRRSARLQTILQTIAEGILVTDENNCLVHINPTAERLLGVSTVEVMGKDVRQVVPNTRVTTVMESGVPELNDIQDMGGVTIVTNRTPIMLGGIPSGVVCTFSEADRIYQAEHRLRGRLQLKGFSAKYQLSDIATRSADIQKLKSLSAIYAATAATVLLQGETGTGKELFAQGMHRASRRAQGPFVAVNCAAIPESLLESELFGHEEGAFTGAKRQGKPGFFEMAHEGTLFLDEISELPHPLQARLLRVLQEKEVVRVGGSQVIPVDLRIICATNRDLEAWTNEGNFRQDLYYRLNVLPITIPSLRERPDDIIHLASLFLTKLASFSVPDEAALDTQIGAQLRSHSWPGNVRELRNVMERLALTAAMFPEKPWKILLAQVWTPSASPANKGASRIPQHDQDCSLKGLTRRFERKTIRALLAEYGGDHSRVSALLGISRMSLWRKLREEDDLDHS